VATVRVDATPRQETNSFIPDRAVGSSIDVLPVGDVDKVYTAQVFKKGIGQSPSVHIHHRSIGDN
jgi:hypothetical protein